MRENNIRKGFKLINLATGEEGWLAHVNSKSAIRVGKYGVELTSIERFSKNLEWDDSEIIIIDEIGPMELKSKEFIKMIEMILLSDKSCLFTIHLKSGHFLLKKVRKEFEVLVIDEKNRDSIADKIVQLFTGERGDCC